MSEYIEREKVIAEAEIEEYLTEGGEEVYHEYVPLSVIKSLPAADVRPVVRGKWKLATYSGKFGNAKEKWYDQFFDGAFWYCDQCRERARKSNFCPNCGAEMEES